MANISYVKFRAITLAQRRACSAPKPMMLSHPNSMLQALSEQKVAAVAPSETWWNCSPAQYLGGPARSPARGLTRGLARGLAQGLGDPVRSPEVLVVPPDRPTA